MGIVDVNEFNRDRLMNTTTKTYKDLVLILTSMTSILIGKDHQTNCLDDDLITYDLNLSMQNQHQPYSGRKGSEEKLGKKIQLLEDINYMKEFRNIVQPEQNLIPPEMVRVIKTIAENGAYFENVGKSIKKEELLNLLDNRLNELKQKIESNRNILFSV
jgi:hypothetical protein